MRAWIFAALLALALVAAPSARAAGDFGTTQAVTPSGCAAGEVDVSHGGLLRGYGSCNDGHVLRLQRAGGRWTRASSGYSGRVVAAADDGSRSYVLLDQDEQQSPDGAARLVLGQKDAGGAEQPLRVLNRGQSVGTGTLVARRGRWWAVWSAAPAGTEQAPRLWQAGTLLRDRPAQPITAPGASDVGPDLGIGARGELVLAWTRGGGTGERVRVAHTSTGIWSSRQLSAPDARAQWPSVLADADGSAIGYRERNGTRLRVALLPVPGRSRTLTRDTDGSTGVALGGSTRAPLVGYGASSRQLGDRTVLARVTSSGLGQARDVTPPQSRDGGLESNAVGQVLTYGSTVTLLFAQQRDSDPDPMYAKDASRLVSRTR